MKGGGEWEEYCPACGLPFGAGYGMEHGHDWMLHAYGFETGDETKHRVFLLNRYDYLGGMTINALRNSNNELMKSEFNIYFPYGEYNDASERNGIAVHCDCVKVIEQNIGRKLTYKDAILLKNNKHKDLMGFDDQWFDWEYASGLPNWMFESPLSNLQAMRRVIKKLPKKMKKQPKRRTQKKTKHKVRKARPSITRKN
jgi:hypothetical protein